MAPSPRSSISDVRRLTAAAELLRALGAPHRLAIVLELTDGPRCVHELVDSLHISQSLASQHLRVLRTTGLVSGVRRGKETLYTLTDDHVARIALDAVTHGSEPGHRTHPVHDPTGEEHQP
jgi:ArsR family transcriptional regulator, zinc-responsive transcriptional repressor